MEQNYVSMEQKLNFLNSNEKLTEELREFLRQYQMIESQVLGNSSAQCNSTKLSFFIANSLILEKKESTKEKEIDPSPINLCKSIYLPLEKTENLKDIKSQTRQSSLDSPKSNNKAYRSFSENDTIHQHFWGQYKAQQCKSVSQENFKPESNQQSSNINSNNNNNNNITLDDVSTCSESTNSMQLTLKQEKFNKFKFITASKKIYKVNLEKIKKDQKILFLSKLKQGTFELNKNYQQKQFYLEYEYRNKKYIIIKFNKKNEFSYEKIDFNTIQLYFGIIFKRFSSFEENLVVVMPLLTSKEFLENYNSINFKEEKDKQNEQFNLKSTKNLIFLIQTQLYWILFNINLRSIPIIITVTYHINEDIYILQAAQSKLISILQEQLKTELILIHIQLKMQTYNLNNFQFAQKIIYDVNLLAHIHVPIINQPKILEAVLNSFSFE